MVMFSCMMPNRNFKPILLEHTSSRVADGVFHISGFSRDSVSCFLLSVAVVVLLIMLYSLTLNVI